MSLSFLIELPHYPFSHLGASFSGEAGRQEALSDLGADKNKQPLDERGGGRTYACAYFLSEEQNLFWQASL